jgi:hypothetical protein
MERGNYFQGRKLVIATKHNKEQVIGPALKEAFGDEYELPTDEYILIDSDDEDMNDSDRYKTLKLSPVDNTIISMYETVETMDTVVGNIDKNVKYSGSGLSGVL